MRRPMEQRQLPVCHTLVNRISSRGRAALFSAARPPALEGMSLLDLQSNVQPDCRNSQHDGAQHEIKPEMEVTMDGNEKIIVRHAFTGSRTIHEVFDDFLTRAIENH